MQFFTMHDQKLMPVNIDDVSVYIQKQSEFAVNMEWYLEFNATRTMEKPTQDML